MALNEKQCTLGGECSISGISLHTGLNTEITIKPAPENTGFHLCRSDVEGKPGAKAFGKNVVNVQRATTILCGDKPVHTVEHVFAALYGSGVDNCIIEMNNPEPPILDGSSRTFSDKIREVGVIEQTACREYCVITEPIFVEQGDSKLVIVPSENDEYKISCTVSYDTSPMGTQYLSLPITDETFYEELSKARTFAEDYEVIKMLMKQKLIMGASLDNANMIKDGAIISKEGVRYPTELVRHKMLDIVGDLSLIGRRLVGHIIAVKPGHPINVALAQKIIETFDYN